MPPVRSTIRVTQQFDGLEPLDMRDRGVNLIYIPDFIENPDGIYQGLIDSCAELFQQHTYFNRFKRQITPHRLTYAHVPEGRRYRYNGKDLHRNYNQRFVDDFFTPLSSAIAQYSGVKTIPNACVCNGYRYNGDDYIAPHTDDEKFLCKGNTEFWEDSTVFTLTFLSDNESPMEYQFSHPDCPAQGYSLKPRSGSLLIQGCVLHSVKSRAKGANSSAGLADRFSLTFRQLYSCCPDSGTVCTKITCPYNSGPSNYLYYSNKGAVP